jgi:hypothetical protein
VVACQRRTSMISDGTVMRAQPGLRVHELFGDRVRSPDEEDALVPEDIRRGFRSARRSQGGGPQPGCEADVRPRATARATLSRTAATATSRRTSRRTSPSDEARTSTQGRRATSATPSASEYANASRKSSAGSRPSATSARTATSASGPTKSPPTSSPLRTTCSGSPSCSKQHDLRDHESTAAERWRRGAGPMSTISRFAAPC